MQCAKLLICDDHPFVRSAVGSIAQGINKDIEVVEAGNSAEALALLRQHRNIDLVLLDVRMPGGNGLDLLSELKLAYPTLPIVVLSSDESRATVMDALERGATGYICKSAPVKLLTQYLEHALNGNIALPIAITDNAMGEQIEDAELPTVQARRQPIAFALSPRQMDVLSCLLRGMSNKQICRELGLANGTVKAHINAIFRSLGVSSRAQAVMEASRRSFQIGALPN